MVEYGIDIEIEKIRKHLLKHLNWLGVEMFGRAYKNVSKDGKLIPEVYIGKGEYREVLTNDLKSVTVFFIDSDKHTKVNSLEMQTDLTVFFIVDLVKLKGNNHSRLDALVQQEVLSTLKQTTQFEISELSKGLDTLKEFDTSKIKLSDMQPYHVFSITGKIKYKINNC
ncbi:hypothetical protein [Flavobacterium sp. I3-2]|uniref:hypothetical protein n=1 Tax=Flavobacterium sp. I3-2 TaxID=2748319 RepID=UPI0015A7738B|nr:hypothetical protein [Flavobacterium sp. I3-2]